MSTKKIKKFNIGPGQLPGCLVKQVGQLFELFLTCSQAKKKPPSWEA